ncbi:hypothetical protein MMC06_004385 [Schaereria dolodes]|nr:hypothetical protein [Schaereria dolodes]
MQTDAIRQLFSLVASLALTFSPSHPEQKLQAPQPLKSNWSGPCGLGARHYLDDAPFSLWDNEKQDFRNPTKQETSWIVTKYSATYLLLSWPEITIRTDNVPNPLPLTVGGVATTFLPLTSVQNDHTGDPRPILITTDYTGSGTVPDPLDFKLRKWKRPTQLELRSIVDRICVICNPCRVFILHPFIIIELQHDDGRVYSKWSLPRRVAGLSAVYHHDSTRIFQNAYLLVRERLITQPDCAWDDGDYLTTYNELYPGVKVESALITDQGPYATLAVASSTGALLRDSHGNQRLTTANHGFLNSNEVYHPFHTGCRIGEIDERWEALNIALVKLDHSIAFSNQPYFEAKPPKRLLRQSQVEYGVWFCADGISTGAVFL